MFCFRSMGTDVTVAAPSLRSRDRERLAVDVADVFARNEWRYSRFLADSELSSLNRVVGPAVVSPEMFEVLRSALRFHDLTGGIFDPTVGAALEALGYDRSFEPGLLDRTNAPVSVPRRYCIEIRLDEATGTVAKPRDVKIDLGGIVKGRTVDDAATLLPANGAIDAGGDVVLRGGGPSGSGWRVDVEDPRDPRRVLLRLVLRDRAIATSGVNRRRWKVGGEVAHHLIDPRTGRSARTDLVQVTVVADRAERAEVLAKAALVLGAERGATLVRRFDDVGAIFARVDGAIERLGRVEVEDA
jgi:thiamine biosynthesis lipoprotein